VLKLKIACHSEVPGSKLVIYFALIPCRVGKEKAAWCAHSEILHQVLSSSSLISSDPLAKVKAQRERYEHSGDSNFIIPISFCMQRLISRCHELVAIVVDNFAPCRSSLPLIHFLHLRILLIYAIRGHLLGRHALVLLLHLVIVLRLLLLLRRVVVVLLVLW